MVAGANRYARSRDDELFTKVLSCAYSLQQQHDRIQSKLPAARFSEILAEVINTQALIRSRKLDPDTAMQLVASRTEKLSGAAGAAIALLDEEMLVYRIGTGIAATLCGFKTRAQDIVSFDRLKSDQLAETDTWQEKVLGGRIVANVLSAPVYRQNTLAGCIQLFSRHGHFDLDGRYVCELMSGIVSHVVETLPATQGNLREARPGPVQLERSLHEDRGDVIAKAAGTRPKLGWPVSKTRELEAGLNKAAMPVNAREKATPSPSLDSPRFAQASLGERVLDSDQTKRAEKPTFRDQQDGEPRNAQMVSPISHRPSPSHGSLALVPSETHGSRIVPNPGMMNAGPVRDTILDAAHRREPLPDASAVALTSEAEPGSLSFQAENEEPGLARSKTWNRVKRMIYPIFVLVFAIGVRVRAGAHNWPLEVIIYILLVLTTLELQSRWSKD